MASVVSPYERCGVTLILSWVKLVTVAVATEGSGMERSTQEHGSPVPASPTGHRG